MHCRVVFACFLTLWPLTNACNFTSPFSARRALLAFQTSQVKKGIHSHYDKFTESRAHQISSKGGLNENGRVRTAVQRRSRGRAGEVKRLCSRSGMVVVSGERRLEWREWLRRLRCWFSEKPAAFLPPLQKEVGWMNQKKKKKKEMKIKGYLLFIVFSGRSESPFDGGEP